MSRLARARVFLAIAAALLLSATVPGQTDTTVDGETRALLDSIREDLVQLRFEQVLAATEALLGRPGLSKAERGEALVLRAQAHVAFGDLDEAENDFREILRLQPGYRPDPSLTPAKALARFDAIRAKMIGTIRLRLDPADASLWLDDEEVRPGPDGEIPALAGRHTLRAERAGHDPMIQEVEVEPGGETAATLELVPNARTIVLRTEPAGVEVWLDGRLVGETEPPRGSLGGSGTAELVIENVPLGEHRFELRKECFRVEVLKDTLAVDLLDRSPKRYKPVTMVPARARLRLRGALPGARLSLDGTDVGPLPQQDRELCPGRRELVVTLGERTLWKESIEFVDGAELVRDVEPRPNVLLLGADDWPAGLRSFGEAFNALAAQPLPAGFDPELPGSWNGLDLPVEVDLAVAVLPARRQGAVDRHYLYSTILRIAELVRAAPATQRPRWRTTTWGFRAVDSVIGGALRVVEVIDAGPAAAAGLRVGDRILEIGGRPVGSIAELEATLGAASVERPLELRWATGRGVESRKSTMLGRSGPLLATGPTDGSEAMIRAAWAIVDSLSDPKDGATALAGLALLFEEHGQFELAVESWRRVDWGSRAGVGTGTSRYYLGRALERLGREKDAIEAYRWAAGSDATTFHDEGPRVAPAAIDRLIDLGVSIDRSVTAR